MKKILNISALLALFLMIFSGCKEEMLSTDQYNEQNVTLKAYGPQPVMRGGTLRFLGTYLEQIKQVIIPGVDPITEIVVVSEGKHSEITVTVPKDGPEPGFITLVAENGTEIVTKTQLTFEEPILIESFSPTTVAPGDVITLKGDYFNLIHEVVFSDGVLVSEKDFLKHTRYEIQVKVPVEARTGVIGIGDLDELNNEDPSVFANVIFTEDELTVAQPEVTSMEAARYKAGETVTIKGENFQYVDVLNLPGAEGVEFTVNEAGTEITFVLPAAAQDGEAVLVAKSGVEVVAGEYVTVVPTDVAAAPQPVKAGAEVTVSGADLDLVTGVELPGAGYVDFVNDAAITFVMPDTATEGDAVLHMTNGKSVTAAFTLVKPVATAYSANPASAGSEMTITGTDLDLVKSVTFGGDLTVEVEATAEAITVAVPTTAESGALKFNLANGTSVECENLQVDKPVACYITELPGEDVELHGGQVLIVPVANEDKLTGVQVNGEDVNYLLNGTTLYINLPSMAGDGTVIRLISSNGAVEYTVDCIPDTVVEKVIWSGSFDLGSWANNFELKPAGLFTAAELQVGQNVRIYGTATAADWAVQIYDGMWAGITIPEGEGNAFKSTSAASANFASDGYIEFAVTEEIFESLTTKGDWGNSVIFNGTGFIITKITVYYEISLENPIWEGSFNVAGWSGNQDLAWGGFDWSSLKAGQMLRFYCTPNDPAASWWCISLRVGDSWGALNGVPGQYDNPTVVEVELTQEILDHLMSANGMVFTGDGCTVTKITVE